VEGHHLAGIGALLELPGSGAAEIGSLYTLTRFAGEGVGGHLVRHAVERARERGLSGVFACTTAPGVVAFFERMGFGQVPQDALPVEKWRDYEPERRARLTCLRIETT
jgi:amino-acid N-acetyltransferase